jgi:ATP-dependent DNA helicase PIF1
MKLKDIQVLPKYLECAASINSGEPFTFVSGKAGVGKSILIKYLSKTLNKKMVKIAPTGIAAINVMGQTVHSFFGFPGKLLTNDVIRIHKNKGKKTLLNQVDVIIIDEVSMIRSDVMDAMDRSLRINRRVNAPFGGVQILVIGDLLQLSPVVNYGERQYFREMYQSPYFFHANVMQHVSIKYIELDSVFRQKDQDYIEALNKIRVNKGHRDSLGMINRRCYGINAEFSKIPRDITLTSTNKRASMINHNELSKIDSPEKTYTAKISGNFKVKMVTPELLTLKIGAKVMFTKNDTSEDDLWVNGTMGIVTELGKNYIGVEIKKDDDVVEQVFVEKEEWEIEKYSYDPVTKKIESTPDASFRQYPLVLAWATTIHKSQGLTLEDVCIDLTGGAFAPGQTYVALSRCKTLERLTLTKPISMKDVFVDPIIVEFYENIIQDQAA